MSPKAYFFDLDGTLTDAREGLFHCSRVALKMLGIEDVSDERLELFIGTPLPDMFRALKPNISHAEIVRGITAFRVTYETHGIAKNSLYPGVADLLLAIKRRPGIAWVVTSKPQPYAERVAKALGIDRLIGGITGAGLAEDDSKGELVARALHATDLAPSQAILLGDRFYDVAGARENGVMPVGALWGYGTIEELHSAGCRLFVKSAAEFQIQYVIVN